MRLYFSIITSLLVLSNIVLAKVGQISFDDLIDNSHCIVVGRTIEVIEIDSVKVAKIYIEKRIKTVTSYDTIFMLAQPTWTCDISEATKGERCLFFLSNAIPGRQLSGKENPVYLLGACPFTQNKIDTYFNKGTFFQIAHAGRGSMPFRKYKNIEYVTLWTADIDLPEKIHTIRGPEKEYDFIRSAVYEEMMNYIDNHLRHKIDNDNK